MPTLPAAWRPPLLLTAGYLAATLFMAAPLVDYGALTTATYVGDARLLVWTLAWDDHAILAGLPLFDANMFYPAPRALRFAEHHTGIALLALPFYAVTHNPVLAYWIVWLAAFVANAVAMHALAYRVTRDHLASAAGALVFAFSFYRMLHAHGHLQLLWTAWLPWSLLALERWYGSPSWRRLALLWALVTIQSLVSWYLAVMVLLAQAIMFLALVASGGIRPRLSRVHVAHLLLAAAAGAVALAWFVRPYLTLTAGGAAEAAALSADMRAYLLPPENTIMGAWLKARTSLQPRWIWGEQTMYVGVLALAYAAAGTMASGRVAHGHARVGALVGGIVSIGLVALALSFGPTPSGLAPFDWLRHVPGLALFRAPARFGLLVLLAVGLLAAIGATRLTARGRRGRAVVIASIPLMLFEWRVVDFPNGKPESVMVPAVYRHLDRLGPGAVVSLPDYLGTDQWFREADYLLFSTAHWRPIVNGYGRSEPPEFRPLMEELRTFPGERAIAALRRNRIRYVILDEVRYGAGGDRVVAQARQHPALRPLETVWPVSLFEVR